MPKTDTTTGRFLDRFDLLFIVTVVTVALLLLVDLDQQSGFSAFLAVTVTILTAATLLLAVAAAGIERRGLQLAWFAAGLTVVASIAAAFLPEVNAVHGGLLWLLLVIAAPIIALKRLMNHKEVTVETLLGAVSVYLLLAVAGAYLFLFIDALGIDGGRFFGESQSTTVFMYFSLVTATTLGYGDFAPAGVLGRAAAVWVAVIGQIYLIVVIARIVTLFTPARRRGESGSGDGD